MATVTKNRTYGKIAGLSYQNQYQRDSYSFNAGNRKIKLNDL
jgi:hypothetical protein